MLEARITEFGRLDNFEAPLGATTLDVKGRLVARKWTGTVRTCTTSTVIRDCLPLTGRRTVEHGRYTGHDREGRSRHCSYSAARHPVLHRSGS